MNPTPALEDRAHAGRLLAERLRELPLADPLVLAIPRGGIEVGLPIAEALGAELDVILSRKLRCPWQPELALGAISESGEVHLTDAAEATEESLDRSIEAEVRLQAEEISRRSARFRAARPPASVAGRSVVVTDDGMATGSTMIAALRTVRARGPRDLIVALPVAPAEELAKVRPLCDRAIVLLAPHRFWAVGQFYRRFDEVGDDRVVAILRERYEPRSDVGPPAVHGEGA